MIPDMTDSDHRRRATKELADILRILGHPDRLRILEELARAEQDVKTLLNTLALPGTRVSQHLRVLRAYRIVDERRAGRRRIYRLARPRFARWIRSGFEVIEDCVASTPMIDTGDAV